LYLICYSFASFLKKIFIKSPSPFLPLSPPPSLSSHHPISSSSFFLLFLSLVFFFFFPPFLLFIFSGIKDIAADEVEWNYTPLGYNKIYGRNFTGIDETSQTIQTNSTIGSKYWKALYREYSDSSFSSMVSNFLMLFLTYLLK